MGRVERSTGRTASIIDVLAQRYGLNVESFVFADNVRLFRVSGSEDGWFTPEGLRAWLLGYNAGVKASHSGESQKVSRPVPD